MEGRWKAVSPLSVAEGSEVKECGDQEEANGFHQKAVIDDFERAVGPQSGRNQWGEK